MLPHVRMWLPPQSPTRPLTACLGGTAGLPTLQVVAKALQALRQFSRSLSPTQAPAPAGSSGGGDHAGGRLPLFSATPDFWTTRYRGSLALAAGGLLLAQHLARPAVAGVIKWIKLRNSDREALAKAAGEPSEVQRVRGTLKHNIAR